MAFCLYFFFNSILNEIEEKLQIHIINLYSGVHLNLFEFLLFLRCSFGATQTKFILIHALKVDPYPEKDVEMDPDLVRGSKLILPNVVGPGGPGPNLLII